MEADFTEFDGNFDKLFDKGSGKLQKLTKNEYKIIRIFLTNKAMFAETEIIGGD